MIVRTSRWAIWARRLGVLAVLVAVPAVFVHRSRDIATPTFLMVEAGAMLLALGAIIAAIIAFARLWHTGDRGWAKGVFGLLLGAACLSPVAYGAMLAFSFPLVSDVSTDLRNPPVLQALVQPLPTDPRLVDQVVKAFPTVTPRRYQLDAPTVFSLVEGLVDARRWDIRVRRAPFGQRGEGRIDAIATTLLGFRDEVAVRVSGDLEGTTVDMRSASLFGESDLGKNGERITAFLADLDQAVNDKLGIARPAAGTVN